MATSTTPGPKPRGRGILLNASLMTLAFGLLGWTIWTNRGQIAQVRDTRPDLRLFALGFGIYLAALLLTFVRWFALVRALGLPFRLADAMRLGFIGNVFNLVIPGAVGGDLIKAAFLCREQERKTLAVGSMVIDRALGLLGLFVLASIAGAVAWPGAAAPVRGLIALAWGAVAAGVVGLAILFTPALYGPLLKVFAGKGKVESVLRELVAMASAYRRRLDVVVGTLALACLSHGLFVMAFTVVDNALYPTSAPSVGRHYIIAPLALFTTAVPLPFGALGLTEKASEGLFDLVGFRGGAVAMMGFRVLMYAGGAVSVLVYLANARQVRDLRQQAEGLAEDAEAGRLVETDLPEPARG
jgi:uncharacterized membrane protein YbhN (UPF0104 family)